MNKKNILIIIIIALLNIGMILLFVSRTKKTVTVKPKAQSIEQSSALKPFAKTGETLLTTQGITDISYGGYVNGMSYQQEGLITYNNWQYVAFYNSSRHVSLARRCLPLGSWQIIEFDDYDLSAPTDSHDTISIGICPGDGTIHLSFDHHAETLHYRKSVEGLAQNPLIFSWNKSLFGSTTNQLSGTTINLVTYPRFIITPNNKMLFEYRSGTSGSGDQVLWEYDGTTHSWTLLGKYLEGISYNVNGYPNGLTYDKNGRLHLTWCWRETTNASTNHDLLYAYSDDNGRTWKNNAGNIVAVAGTSYLSKVSPGLIVKIIGQNRGLLNQEAQAVDSKGRIHVLYSHMPDGVPDDSNFTSARTKSVYFHYWRTLDGIWHQTNMNYGVVALFRGKLAFSSDDTLYAILPDLKIAYASAISNWSDWTIDNSESNRFFSDPLIDSYRLKTENKLSIFYPTINSGNIYILDYDLQTIQPTPTATSGFVLPYREISKEVLFPKPLASEESGGGYSPYIFRPFEGSGYLIYMCNNTYKPDDFFRNVGADRVSRVESMDGKTNWNWNSLSDVINGGPDKNSNDYLSCSPGVVIDQQGKWHIYYVTSNSSGGVSDLYLYHAISSDGIGVRWENKRAVQLGNWTGKYLETPSPILIDGKIVIYFIGPEGALYKMISNSADYQEFSIPQKVNVPPEALNASSGRVKYINGVYYYIFSKNPTQLYQFSTHIFLSTSTDGENFTPPKLLFSTLSDIDSGWIRNKNWSPDLLIENNILKVYYASNNLGNLIGQIELRQFEFGCTVQGMKPGGENAKVVLDNQEETAITTNPYYFRNISPGIHRIKVVPPEGKSASFSLCSGCTNHPGSSYQVGNEVMFNCEGGSYADLWWNFVPATTSTLNFKIKFQGISSNNTVSKTVNIILKQGTQTIGTFNNVSVANINDGTGKYLGSINNINPGTYDILVKGFSHLQRKFTSVSLASGTNNLDWSNTTLLAGDFDNDNWLKINDISLILSKYTALSTPAVSDNINYDLNGDSIIDMQDISLVLINYIRLETEGER